MKPILFFLSVVGLICGAAVPPLKRSLQDDLNDFLDLLPQPKILSIVLDYLTQDKQVQDAVMYLQSQEFKDAVVAVDTQPEVKDLLNFLQSAGLDAYGLLNRILDLLGLPHVSPRTSALSNGGVNGLIRDVVAVLPLSKLKALYQEKLKTSADFKVLVEKISSQEFYGFVKRMRALPEVQKIEQKLKSYGVNVDAILDLIKLIFGWNRQALAHSLQDDLNDFLALLPQPKILSIVLDYLTQDKQVQDAVMYLQSQEFKDAVVAVDTQPEVKDLLNFLQSAGLDGYGLLNRVLDLLGLPHITSRNSAQSNRGVNGLIKDVMAVLPLSKLKALYQEKLKTSADFKVLVEKISSQEFYGFVERMRALPVVQKIEQKLKSYGVNVDAILDLIKLIFGWNRQALTHSVQDDLNDFLDLLPQPKILSIVLDYLTQDKQVQDAVMYLQSQEFKDAVLAVDTQPEVKDLLNFLQSAGLDAFGLLNRILDLLGLPHVTQRNSAQSNRGVNGLIRDVVAVLPLSKLKALYQEKLKTSADFKVLVEKIGSQEFYGFVKRMRALPEVQIIEQKLKNYGVNVDAILDLIKLIFGWNRQALTHSLQDDLNDFLDLLPQPKILSIVLDYLTQDKQVQDAVMYLQSQEFKDAVVAVDTQPEVKDLLNFLQSAGLDAYGLLNRILDLLGLPHVSPRTSAQSNRGVNGLIRDIVTVLPLSKLKALYQEKLKTSADFNILVEKISSQEFYGFVKRMRALSEVQKIEQKLKSYGVNVDAILDLIKLIFGWNRQALTHSLQDDLNDFLDLLPQPKILSIVLDYLTQDKQVQDAVMYLQSQEFKDAVVAVDTQPEVKDLLNFLQSAGLDAYGLLNRVLDLLGLPHVSPRNFAQSNRGVNGLIRDIVAVLPLSKLKALYQEKLKTSADFKILVEKISSQEFYGFVKRMRALPEVQKIEQKLKSYGVNVDAVMDLVRLIFGWNNLVITRSLQDDLDDFLALLPQPKILSIVLDYLTKDKQVQDAVMYLQSQEFKDAVVAVDTQPEVEDLLNYLQSTGLDAYGLLNRILDLLGLPHVTPRKTVDSTRGINGLIRDIIAVLPLSELKTLCQEKLKTSADFKTLMEKLNSQEFQDFITRVRDLSQVQKLEQKLKSYGVNVDAIIALIKHIFGWS